nr:hypothetical transcript [Hymenolepis microstoma]
MRLQVWRISYLTKPTVLGNLSGNFSLSINNTSSEQQAQASALMQPMLSANTNTSHSYIHFSNIHHQTSHPPPLSTTPTPPMTPQTTQPRRQYHQCAEFSHAEA